MSVHLLGIAIKIDEIDNLIEEVVNYM